MIRFIYFSDFHGSAARPIWRIDEDFVTTQLGKLTEILLLADKYKATILFGGDMWQSFSPALYFVHMVCKILQKHREKHAKVFPIESCIGTGSHELEGGALVSSDYSATYFLETLGFMSLEKRITIEEPETVLIDKIYGSENILEKKFTEEERQYNAKFDFSFLMTHHNIYPGSFPYETIAPEKLVHLPYDVILCSHIHTPFETEVEGKLFLNPGCLVRRRIDEVHQPACYLIEMSRIKGNRKMTHKKIYLKSAKEVSKVFSDKPKITLQNYEEFLASFKEGVSAQSFESLLVEALEVLKMKDNKVKEKVIREFSIAREQCIV